MHYLQAWRIEGSTSRETDYVQFHFWLKKSVHERLAKQAKLLNISKAKLVSQVLSKWLAGDVSTGVTPSGKSVSALRELMQRASKKG